MFKVLKMNKKIECIEVSFNTFPSEFFGMFLEGQCNNSL